MNIADLKLHEPDASGVEVEQFYARNPPNYAVYRTVERVTVQFADDPAKAADQRKALSQLAPVRGEINGLVDGWRSANMKQRIFIWFGWRRGPKLRDRAKRYDRQSADALIVALEGDVAGAEALLKSIRDDAKGERVGWARFEYLLTAFFAASVITLIAVGVAYFDKPELCSFGRMLCFQHAWDIWRGMMTGAFGGFFSIALAIRGRTVLTDLFRTSNLMDAALRVVIGAIAGGVLVALVDAGFVQFHLGDSSIDKYGAIHIFIVGFVAGFAERLVPDLLSQATVKTGEAPITRKPEPQPEAGRKAGAAGGPADAVEEAAEDELATDPVPEQAVEDSCAADIELPDDEATLDSDLPPASGGVARSGGDEQ